ncbi:Hypothetical protein CINCED_3A016794 [Cinara cedri]|nr:Hypothetical protein CINCED_3A016794 [Cinara cedri]
MHEFNCESLEMFKKCFVRSEKKLDILLTSPWPTDVYNNDNTNNISFSKENLDTKCVSNLLSWIAINVTPNYHFSGMQGIYYERTPYKSPNNQITRFIALGNYYNINEPETNPKPKWFYDFILKKKKLIAPKDTIVTTNSPYSATFEYCVQPISKEYFTKISASDRALRIQKFKERSNQTSEGKTDVCLLCWSNQTSANKHMIVSTGDLVYLAGSKSPLVQENLFISTIGHYKSFNRISKIGQFEVNMFKLSLIKYFQSSGRQVVFFEQNIMSTHFNLQAIPVPVSNNMIDRIKCAFIAKFKEHGLNLEPIYEKALLYKMITSEGYFYLELPERKYYLYTTYNKDNTEFPSLIAREVLASKSLLDIEDRIDEKNCTKDISEETKDIETFKVAFKVFNKFKEVEKE